LCPTAVLQPGILQALGRAGKINQEDARHFYFTADFEYIEETPIGLWAVQFTGSADRVLHDYRNLRTTELLFCVETAF
jgi:hypothetical protein